VADTAQEKTEEPTARRLQKAREEGQVARSVELPAAVILISCFLLFMLAGGWLVSRLTQLFASGFVFDRKTLEQPTLLPTAFAAQATEGLILMAPVLGLTLVLAVVSAGMTGGYLLSFKAVAPKMDKINPINGFKRMFGPKALVELAKAILKFSLVSAALWVMLMSHLEELVMLGRMGLEPALALSGDLIAKSALAVSLTLALIAMLDVPYQKYEFKKNLRMTMQEIKDEMKDIEGRPEVKAQIRRRQREIANARMIQRVKTADVVITNPEHFAVALEYDPNGDSAPILVAKGSDFMAAKIREEARTHGVHLFSAPELARALYFTTEADQPVPESLYLAVAQVIAYVFSLEGAQPGQQGMARPSPTVPDSMLFDTEGHRVHAQAA
jgi:flagellar biosynthesis protein FlhB